MLKPAAGNERVPEKRTGGKMAFRPRISIRYIMAIVLFIAVILARRFSQRKFIEPRNTIPSWASTLEGLLPSLAGQAFSRHSVHVT